MALGWAKGEECARGLTLGLFTVKLRFGGTSTGAET